MTFTFSEAVFEDVKVKIGISGPGGSGKTTCALMIAAGLGGKTALIDTENKRSLKYANDFTFDMAPLDPPFRPGRYAEAINAAVKAGYDNIIVDSGSHEHEGIGGLLEWHDEELTRMAGNDWQKREKLKFTAWIKPKAERNQLLQTIQRCPANLIICFRAKDKLAMVKNSQGKNEPVSIGFQPICGQEFPYEMDVFFMLPAGSEGKPDWTNENSRVNTLDPAFKKALQGQISRETGKRISEWAKGGRSGPSAPRAGVQDSGKTMDDTAPPAPASPPAGMDDEEYDLLLGNLENAENINALGELKNSIVAKADVLTAAQKEALNAAYVKRKGELA